MKIDLHTHTHRSGDSTTTYEEYIEAFQSSNLDKVAVTDHLTIEGALNLRERLGDTIIIGQEFRVKEGELIGLFIEKKIPPGLDARTASKMIRDQGGLVYVPHPGDQGRTSLTYETLSMLANEKMIDIIEIGNSRWSPNGFNQKAQSIATKTSVSTGAGSDSHVETAIGSSYCDLGDAPWNDSSQFLLALSGASLTIDWFDPPRKWKSRIVPSSH
ncbi:PHP domain-containing protein [Acidithrix sp. C25]|uniref:PHP domain-containing protein n=1 Tax=Acidithrix sp. C25 TaxID=1671482 RepID=UPI00191BC6CC|nr:PHP domain-containing protein [Acidithrix sp. C25]CAG4918787.1 unnamed protein product [Acidithrix sp. C25]